MQACAVFLSLSLCIFCADLYAQSCSIPGNAGNATITAQPNTFFPGTGSPATSC